MVRFFSSSACLAAVFWLLLAAVPARAEQFPAGELLPLGPQAAPNGPRAPLPPYGHDLLGNPTPSGDPELLSSEMIRDENRFKLELFTLSRETLIPLASAHLYIIHEARVSQVKRGKVEELAPEERPPLPWNIKHLPSGVSGLPLEISSLPSGMSGLPPDINSLPETLLEMDKVRGLLESKPLPGAAGWRPLGWLLEEDGLLSGQAWSWENFMPRLLTVAGLVLGVLLAVEVLRVLLTMGARAAGGKED